MTTRIFTADTSSLSDGVLFNYYYSKMSEYRREKTDRMRFDGDKRLSLGVGILLDIAADEYGVTDRTLAFGKQGKPYFRSTPDVCFSLSHSGTQVMCAVSDSDIGCDTEMIEKCDWRLSERFYSSAEREYVLSQTDEIARKTAFCRIWTLKESYVKMLGTGFLLGFDCFSVDVTRPTVTVDCNTQPTDCSFIELQSDGRYFYSVCRKGLIKDAEIKRINFKETGLYESYRHT